MDLLDYVRSHWERHPSMNAQDSVKLLYQAVLGPQHLLSGKDLFDCTSLEQEMSNCTKQNIPLMEPVSDSLCRLHLNSVHNHLRPQTIQNITAATAQLPCGSEAQLDQELSRISQWCAQNHLTDCACHIEKFAGDFRRNGYAPVHHSNLFRRQEDPHYRLADRRWMTFMPVLEWIDEALSRSSSPVTVALDGRCASGKSTLAQMLSRIYPCNVFHMDDFFLPPHRRTPERLREPGGNVDRERFCREIMIPLRQGGSFSYGIYSCHTGKTTPSPQITPKPLNIVEGSYSLHPLMQEQYDLRFFLTCSPQVQKQRILERNGEEMLAHFIEQWIPMEETYFETFSIPSLCQKIIYTDSENPL